jgi:hypothetical protein
MEFEGTHGSKRHTSTKAGGDDATGTSQDKRTRVFDFERVWDDYEQQTQFKSLSEMPELRSLSKEEYELEVLTHRGKRFVGEFVVYLYVGQSWVNSGGGIRPHPTKVDEDWFKQNIVNSWNKVSDPVFEVWNRTCTRKSPVLSYVHLENSCSGNKNCNFIAFHRKTLGISGAAQCCLLGNELVLQALTSKLRGAGHVLMTAVEAAATAWGMSAIYAHSVNWIAADNEAACQNLFPGEYRSLNKFYKRHGSRDTAIACSREWARHPAAQGVIEAPVQRRFGPMSKCLSPATHVDHLDWVPR